MKSKTKKVLAITGATLIGLAFLAKKKVTDMSTVIENLQFAIKQISDIKLNGFNLSFSAILNLHNTTNIDFGATLSSKIIVKEIRVYSSQKVFLGKAVTNISSIVIPANTVSEISRISFNLLLENSLNEFLNNFGAFLNNDFSSLIYEIDIEAFGKTFTLEA